VNLLVLGILAPNIMPTISVDEPLRPLYLQFIWLPLPVYGIPGLTRSLVPLHGCRIDSMLLQSPSNSINIAWSNGLNHYMPYCASSDRNARFFSDLSTEPLFSDSQAPAVERSRYLTACPSIRLSIINLPPILQ
jgi:hypothetical protein